MLFSNIYEQLLFRAINFHDQPEALDCHIQVYLLVLAKENTHAIYCRHNSVHGQGSGVQVCFNIALKDKTEFNVLKEKNEKNMKKVNVRSSSVLVVLDFLVAMSVTQFPPGMEPPFSDKTPNFGYPSLSEVSLKSYPLFLRAIQIVTCKLYEAV